VNLTNQVGDVRFKHEFSPNWHLVVGVLDQRVDRIINSEVNNLTDAAGDYSASLATGFTPRFNTYSNLAYVNGQFHTGPIAHDFVAGSTGYKFDTYSYYHDTNSSQCPVGHCPCGESGFVPQYPRRACRETRISMWRASRISKASILATP
jgi:hypothetical protein